MSNTEADKYFDGELGQIINGYRATQIAYVAVKLRIPDLLSDGPKNADELAAETGTNPSSLYRALRGMAGIGILDELDDLRFGLSEIGEDLREDVPGSRRPMALLSGEEFFWKPWSQFLEAVTTGEPSFGSALGSSQREYMDGHPEVRQVFQGAMTGGTEQQAASILDAYDFTEFNRIADVGGGHGALLCSVLEQYPDSSGLLFDIPPTAEAATIAIAERGLSGRCEAVGGDATVHIPGGNDLIMMKAVIHGMSDEIGLKLLRTCNDALNPGGTLLVIERVVPEHGTPSNYTMSDLNMLVMTSGGRGSQRTESQYLPVLDSAGFEHVRTIETGAEQSIIESRKR